MLQVSQSSYLRFCAHVFLFLNKMITEVFHKKMKFGGSIIDIKARTTFQNHMLQSSYFAFQDTKGDIRQENGTAYSCLCGTTLFGTLLSSRCMLEMNTELLILSTFSTFNTFQANVPFLYPLKTSENQRLSLTKILSTRSEKYLGPCQTCIIGA